MAYTSNKNVREWAETVIGAVERVFYGKREVIEKLLVALLCRGHVLLEDVPGLGKTILARAISITLGGAFNRIQCTPDLLPADVIGVSVYNPKEGTFRFRRGPIQGNLILVDEINRATPRTQSALLEAMGEGQVTVEGKLLKLPDPFFLMATENPVEFEGTFPLPEAQKDRFLLSLGVGYPSREDELHIVTAQRRVTHPISDLEAATDLETVRQLQEQVVNVHVDDQVANYIISLVEATRKAPEVRVGVSPRGSLALYKTAQAHAAIRGRDYVVPEDVKELVRPVFGKRMILSSDAMIKGRTPEGVIDAILDSTEVPVLREEA